MKYLRLLVRKILLEDWGSDHGVNDYGCGQHSAGFIDADGKFHGLNAPDGETHDDWLMNQDMDGAPDDWIVCHNSQQLTINLDKLNLSQIDTLIDFWLYCRKSQNWIKEPEKTEHSLTIFSHHDSGMDELTIPELLEMYGTDRQMDRFFNTLFG